MKCTEMHPEYCTEVMKYLKMFARDEDGKTRQEIHIYESMKIES